MSTTYRDFNRALIQDLRTNGGRPTSGPFMGRDVLILTTKGAKSGEVRENPLVYSRDNGHYVIIASKGGAPTHPSWYHNLVSDPNVTVEILGEKFSARARVSEGAERDRLYAQHGKTNPAFLEYEKRTTRKIPAIVLERVE